MPNQPVPYVSMPVVYRAIGGSEYAALITDVRPEGVSLATFLPGSVSATAVTRIPFKTSPTDLRPSGKEPFCYFVQPPRSGFEPTKGTTNGDR